jgi:hypothetical protein
MNQTRFSEGGRMLSIPTMILLCAILRNWFTTRTSIALSVTVVLLAYSLFEPRERFKEMVIVTLLIGLSVYIVAYFLRV